jgi:type I restriction enzyme S subunit
MTFKLSDICIGGGSYGIAASAVEFSTDLPTYLRITDINDDGTLNESGLKSVDDPNSAKYYLSPNDIVFARTGASTGRNYFYDGSDGEFVYAGFLIKFSIDPRKVNPLYVKYYCQSKDYYDWVASFNTGSTRGNINAQTLANMPIPILERDQQNLIADTLAALDARIAENKAINHHLEQIAQAIFKSWFVDFDPWGGVMPDDWHEGTLGDVASITSGKRPPYRQAECSVEAEIPLLGASSIMGYTNAVLYNERILVTGRVGTHGVIQRYSRPCWASDNTLVIKSHFYEFTYQQLCGVDFRNMNRGSTQPLITQTDLKNVLILLPDEATLREFEELVGSFMGQYEANILESERLAELRDALLPRLMSGELSVCDVDAK